jgi:23S rRNA pseudouridine955/2504/2580 synthase
MISYSIETANHCRTIESYLRRQMPDASIAYVRKLLRSEYVTVNGAPVPPAYLLSAGDQVAMKESKKIQELLARQAASLDILYEDDRILALNKAPGIPVHKAAEDQGINAVDLAQRFLADKGLQIKLRPINRLDRGTSGGVLLAKSAVAAGMFGRLVKTEGLDKLYLAIVAGAPPEEGIIDTALEGKECETHFRLLFKGKGNAFLAVQPITGRMHQIRQHLQLIGHPVTGDRRYGGIQVNGLNGHFLHSFRTSFSHPETGEKVVIHAPLPPQFLKFLAELSGSHFQTLLQGLKNLQS